MLLLVLAVALAVAVPLGVGTLLTGPAPPSEQAAPAVQDAEVLPEQDTLLLIRLGREPGAAESVTLLAAGPADAEAVALFIPVGTLVSIPGIGLDRLGLAQQYGGSPLLQSALENALGVRIDHAAAVTSSALAAFLGRSGGLEVDIPQRLVRREDDGSGSVRFEPGRQFLDGQRLAELWGFRTRDEDELATFARQQTVLERLLAHLAQEDGAVQRLVGDGAPQLDTTADAEWLERFFSGLAAAQAQERLTFTLLPVEPFGGEGPDGGATYRLRDEAARGVTQRFLAASVPADAGQEPVRIQILNGVGVPGIGQQVERLLGGGAYRIVRSDNAAHFDFAQTRIIVYEETQAARQAAERVRSQLGVGTIQVSRQPQSVTDLTIVVGADFVDEHGIPDVDGPPGTPVDELPGADPTPTGEADE